MTHWMIALLIGLASIVFRMTEGFKHCPAGQEKKRLGITYGCKVSYIPDMGEECKSQCHNSTCVNRTCRGNLAFGSKCNTRNSAECKSPGPNGRDTYCEGNKCIEVPKMSFN